MKDLLGILGFLLLIIGSVFLDTPIIALLAIPIFLIGFVLILIFYLQETEEKYFSTFLLITGVVLFCFAAGYSAVEYNQYHGIHSKYPETPWGWNRIIQIAVFNILAATLIYVGIKIGRGKNYKGFELFILVLPTLLVIPITLFIIKLFVLSGHWLGAGG